MTIKSTIITYLGIICSVISNLFGGWNTALTTLCIFMCIDYITGILCAVIFKNSPKTNSGGLSSNVCKIGLIKKCCVLIFVFIGARLDIIMNTHILRDGVCSAFIVSELISITENIGIMGVPMPKVIKEAIDVLNKRNDNES